MAFKSLLGFDLRQKYGTAANERANAFLPLVRQPDKEDTKHGITTLLLSQALGMTSDPALEERLRQAVDKAILVTVAAAKVTAIQHQLEC